MFIEHFLFLMVDFSLTYYELPVDELIWLRLIPYTLKIYLDNLITDLYYFLEITSTIHDIHLHNRKFPKTMELSNHMYYMFVYIIF